MERGPTATPPSTQQDVTADRREKKMVLKKSFRVLRRYKPRSVLLESREIEGETLLFESNTIATLSESFPFCSPL